MTNDCLKARVGKNSVGTQHCCVLLVISHQSLDLNCRHSLSSLERHLRCICALPIRHLQQRN